MKKDDKSFVHFQHHGSDQVLVMQYCPGGNLQQLIRRFRSLAFRIKKCRDCLPVVSLDVVGCFGCFREHEVLWSDTTSFERNATGTSCGIYVKQ